MLASFRRLDSQDYFDMLFRDHLQQSQQALNFVNSIRTKNENLYLQKQIVLEQKEFYRSKKTLIFDLDETLIHCNQSEQVQSDCMVDIEFPNGERVKVGINIRPFCQEILRELSYFYEIIVFTASHQSYANEVIDLIDPQKQLIQHRLYREHCIQTEEGVYVKDLRIIKNRKIENIILVDNAAYSFGFQVSNGIPILPFYDNKQDSELKDLCNFLKLIHNSDNIQQILNNLFKMNEYVKCQDYQEVVQLYN